MKGTYLRLYVLEKRRHCHMPLYEWILMEAKHMGVRGGSVFRAIEGYDRRGIVHAQHFFELQGDLPIEVEFLLSDEQAEQLLSLLRDEKIRFFYARVPAEFELIERKE